MLVLVSDLHISCRCPHLTRGRQLGESGEDFGGHRASSAEARTTLHLGHGGGRGDAGSARGFHNAIVA